MKRYVAVVLVVVVVVVVAVLLRKSLLPAPVFATITQTAAGVGRLKYAGLSPHAGFAMVQQLGGAGAQQLRGAGDTSPGRQYPHVRPPPTRQT